MHRLPTRIRTLPLQTRVHHTRPPMVARPTLMRWYSSQVQNTASPSSALLHLYSERLEEKDSPDISKLTRGDFASICTALRRQRHWGNDEKILQLLEDMKAAGHPWSELEFNEFFMTKLYQARYQDILDRYHGEFQAQSIKPSVRLISVLLATYLQMGKTNEATELVREAEKQWGVAPNIRDFDSTLNQCMPHTTGVQAAGHALIVEHALKNTLTLNNNLIHLFHEKRAKDCKWIYDQVRTKGKLDLSTYAILIKGFVDAQNLVDAKNVYQHLQSDGQAPTPVICSHMLTIYAHNRDMQSAEQIVRDTVLAGHSIDVAIYSQLIRVYFKARATPKALRAFESIVKDSSLQVNTILLNTMIDGLVINKEMKVARLLYQQMEQSNIKPDMITFNTLLKGFTRQGDFEAVQGVVCDMKKHGLDADTVTLTTLIDAVFATKQPQSLDDVLRVLQNVGMEPNVYTFNTIINGWITNNKMDEAEKTLELMRSPTYKLRPTVHTYTNLIQGYVRQMNLAKALHFFQESMAMDCRPDRATFNYIIKVLLEFDRLDDGIASLTMMRKMNRNPTTDTWRILMNECIRKRDWNAGAQVVQALDESGFVIKSDALQRTYTLIKQQLPKI